VNLVAVVERAREVVASLGNDVRKVGRNVIVIFGYRMYDREVR